MDLDTCSTYDLSEKSDPLGARRVHEKKVSIFETSEDNGLVEFK